MAVEGFPDIVCDLLFLLNNFPLQSLEYATYSCGKLTDKSVLMQT